MGIISFFKLISSIIVRFFKFILLIISRFFKLILLIIECITFFIAVIVIQRSINQAGLSEITLMVSAVLFPLMALFIWLDSTRYRVYIPLFTAGKFIGVFSILGFPVITGQNSNSGFFSRDVNLLSLLLVSYLFSILVVILLFIMERKSEGEKLNEENKLEVV